MDLTMLDARTDTLPESFARWFASRGWEPRAHQLELLAKARAGRSVLLIAPTGAGKTLAGFLPSLVELSDSSEASGDLGRPSPRTRSAPSPLVGEGWGEGWPQTPDCNHPPPCPSPTRGRGRCGTIALRQRKPSERKRAHLHRPLRPPRGRAAHALHLPAEGARGRHRTQSRDAGRRDAAANPRRDPHRRHARVETPTPAPRPAAHPAHHARAARAHPRLARRAIPLRHAAPRRARRAARAYHQQARRSSVARPRAPVPPRARSHQRRPVRHRRRAR